MGESRGALDDCGRDDSSGNGMHANAARV